jgi:hypothetical protein
MGCSQSKDLPQATSSPGSVRQPASAPEPVVPVPQSPSPSYVGVELKLPVLCRDEFESKYTGETMYRWRPAEIIDIDEKQRNNVLVHYTGWSDTFDLWVNLEEKGEAKLAPFELLGKEQITKGYRLSDDQLAQTHAYFLYGTPITPPGASEPLLNTVVSPSDNENEKGNFSGAAADIEFVERTVTDDVAVEKPPPPPAFKADGKIENQREAAVLTSSSKPRSGSSSSAIITGYSSVPVSGSTSVSTPTAAPAAGESIKTPKVKYSVVRMDSIHASEQNKQKQDLTRSKYCVSDMVS